MIPLQDKELTEKIIACAFKVHGVLGYGFLEKVYENALLLELKTVGLSAERQAPISVSYAGQPVGEYYADLLVEGKVVCELKAVSELSREHETQLVNYLTATGLD